MSNSNTESITQLNHYRRLGRSGMRVSPLCLGTMTFGNDWGWGADEQQSRKIFDMYLERGGNFIDTANLYTAGTSETYLGRFIQSVRDELVLATKYTFNMRAGDPNAGGNHRKNMMQSIEASLKRLQTDYIDLYWVHVWDQHTPIDDLMRGLDDLVKAGKVLYIAVSDFPAWKIAQANTLSELMGWSQFTALQIEYNLAERCAERDLIPMSIAYDIAVLPWSPLCGGVLSGKYSLDDAVEADMQPASAQTTEAAADGTRRNRISYRLNKHNLEIAEEVKTVAKLVERTPAQVALNWLMQKPGVVSPVIGARTLAQLEDNLACLDFTLTPQMMQRLDAVSAIELGFPHDFIYNETLRNMITGNTQFT